MARTSRPSARLIDDQARATMKNEFTHPEAEPLTIERSSRPGVKILVASGVALAATAAVIAASHVLAPSVGPGRGPGATERRRQRSASA